jgi:hypothetical protein
MAKALADAQTKGVFLATNSGTTLGGALTVTEQGGYIECADPSGYAEYQGEQPDFGYGLQVNVTPDKEDAAAPEAASSVGSSRQVSHRPKVKSKHPVAKKAAVTSCNLTAQVAVVYGVS